MGDYARNESVSVGTTSTQILFKLANAKRENLVIRNVSPNAADIITLSFGNNAAVANKGIVLKQNDAYTESNSDNFEVWNDQIQAICATANGVLAIMER